MPDEKYFDVDSDPSLAKRIRLEREKARRLRRTIWWQHQIGKRQCHYCGKTLSPSALSMDHVVPLARGGKSTKANIVPACLDCNRRKKLETPAESLLRALASRDHAPHDSLETP